MKSIKLDRKGEQEKSEEIWEASLQYFRPIFISAFKIMINGQDYFPQH